jgi:chemotaxis protein CheC
MPYTDTQLDALRELANIGSGSAATALSLMLGRSVGLTVPEAHVLPLGEAVDTLGAPESVVVGVALGVEGDLDATVLLLFPVDVAGTLCDLLGIDPGGDLADSALGEIGNILGTSYINALSAMTGLVLRPTPPTTLVDMLAAIVATALAATAGDADLALVLDSELSLAGVACSLSFLLLPTAGGVGDLLARLGVTG